MSKIINVGRVTSYADAVAGGYTGTREEWENDLANLGTTAAEVEADRQEVAANTAAVATDKGIVEGYKDAANLSAQASAASAGAAHTDALAATAAKEAAETAQGLAESAKDSAVAAKGGAETAQGAAEAAVTQASGYADNASGSATAAAGSATAAAGSATDAAASATAAAGSAGEAEAVLDSIPEDYSELSGDVADLKSAIAYAAPIDLKQEMLTGFITNNVGVGNVVSPIPSTSTSKYKIVPCKKGDKFDVQGSGTNSDARAWALVDAEYRLYAISNAKAVNDQIKADQDGYAIFNLSASSYSGQSDVSMYQLLQYSNEDRINALSELTSVNVTNEFVNGYSIKTGITTGRTVDVDSPVARTNNAYYIAPMRAGEKATLSGTGSSDYRLWAFTDKSYVVQRISAASISETDLVLTAMQDGYLIVNNVNGQNYSLILHKYVALEKISNNDSIINIKDLGAIGDGLTDDTTAIIKALTIGAGKTIYIPKGTYIFNKTLHVKSGTKLVGCGDESVLQVADTYSLDTYDWRVEHEDEKQHTRFSFIIIDRTENGVTLEDFVLKGQTVAFVDACLDGISVQGKNNIVRNVSAFDINYFYEDFLHRVYSGVGRAINVIFADNCVVENCVTARSGYEGIGVEESSNITVSNCRVGNACQTGIQIHRKSFHIKIIGNFVNYDSDKTNLSFTLHANVGFDMDDIVAIGNCFSTGMTVIGGAENGVKVLDNYFKSGGITNNAAIYRQRWHIRGNRFDSGGITMRIDNCIITDNMLTVNVGYQMINMHGNNVIAENNIPLGSVSGVYIEPHN